MFCVFAQISPDLLTGVLGALLDLRLLTGGPFLETRRLLRLSGLLGTLRKLPEEEEVGELLVLTLEEKVLLLVLEKVEPADRLLISFLPSLGGGRVTQDGTSI